MAAQIGLERLTGLIAFGRAASLGGYTAAARALGVSPSAVSKSVQRLEQQFGLSLFTRTTRSLTLTPEGRDLHERAMRLLREAEEIEQAALATRAEPKGTIRIAAPLPIGVHVLGPALPGLCEQYPQLRIDLRLADRFVDVAEEGIDVAIRVGDLADTRLLSKKLGPHRLCAYAAPSYLEKFGTPQHPDKLSGHRCVNFRFQSSGQSLRWPFLIGRDIVEFVPDAAITVDTSDGVSAVLIAGGGIGISATYIAAPHVARGELVPILEDYALDRSSVTAVWPESRRHSPNVKAVLHFLTELWR